MEVLEGLHGIRPGMTDEEFESVTAEHERWRIDEEVMRWTESGLIKSLVAWLRWHAATRKEIESAPENCRPILDAMSKASGCNIVARLASRIEQLDGREESS